MTDFEKTELYQLLKSIDSDTRLKCLKLLKNGSVDLNLRDNLGNGYLHFICSHPEILKWDVGCYLPIFYQFGLHGINVNAQNNEGNTALHFAVTNRLPLRALNVLMKLGGDATLSNNNGLSPVHLAEDTRFAEMVSIMHEGLISSLTSENESAVEFLLNSWCYPNSSSLHGLFQEEDLRNWKVMEKNRFVHVTLAGDAEEMKKLYNESIDLTCSDLSNLTSEGKLSPLPLICDVFDLGLVESLKFMTRHHKCSNLFMYKEGTLEIPFWLHCLKTFTEPRTHLVLPLLQNVELKPDYVDVDLITSLYERNISPDVIYKLITLGYKLWTRDQDGRTFRDRVLINSLAENETKRKENLNYVDQHVIKLVCDNELDMLRELLENGYDHILVENLQGRNALSIARKQKVKDDVISFLEGVANWQLSIRAVEQGITYCNLSTVRDHISPHIRHCRDKHGRTFLHLAALYNREFITRLLLREDLCRPDVNATDRGGRTPLLYAYSIPEAESVQKLLVVAGAKLAEHETRPQDAASSSLIGDRSLPDPDLDLYLLERYLTLAEAVRKGLRDRVCKLCETMYKDCDINMLDNIQDDWKHKIKYKHLLQLCVEETKEEIGMYFLRLGIRFDHVQMADQIEAGGMISLGEAAQQRDMYNLVRQIKRQKAARRFEAKVNALVALTNPRRSISSSDPELGASGGTPSGEAPTGPPAREGSDPCLSHSTGDSGVLPDAPAEVRKSTTCTIT